MRIGLLIVAFALPGCSTLGYYSQSIHGHLSLLAQRHNIATLIADGEVDEPLKRDLEQALAIRNFASLELALPNNPSYRSYVDVGRPFVLWNVVVTEELSLRPLTWCFPIVGCVAYRGYYAQADAEAFAQGLREQGYDVFVGGVRAYSTLGWFDDPLLSTMLNQPRAYLIGVIFHELAHQLIYIKDDTTFNESFAVAVEREGVRRWFQLNGSRESLETYRQDQERDQRFIELILGTRIRLETLYGQAIADSEKRRLKKEIFSELRTQYHQDPDRFGPGYDHWFDDNLNNARLALIATYHEQGPAFERLLQRHGGDFRVFYAAVEEIGRLPPAERAARLKSLTADE